MNDELEDMWRRRLARCRPLTLVDTMQTNAVPEVRQLASEELDRQLQAAGFRPNRPAPPISPSC